MAFTGNSANRKRVGVIGAGTMGFHYLRKLRHRADVDLVGFYDPDELRSSLLFESEGVRPYRSLDELLFELDAAVIASPTVTHFANGVHALRAGVHLLIEKPFCANLLQATQLVEQAERNGLVLQAGFIERHRIANHIERLRQSGILYACFQRHACRPGREKSLSVLWDLMIHDLDIALDLSPEIPRIEDVQASSVSSADAYDYGRCRLRFESGFVAELVASRVGQEATRSMYALTHGYSQRIDFMNSVEDPLADQINYFLNGLREPATKAFSGNRVLRVLDAMERIHQFLDKQVSPREYGIRPEGFT